ncbi:glycosyltransferase family 4 protein [Desulforhopalus sp. 52FAK]
MPFKAMGHSNPSGDLIIGTELFNHLQDHGHDITLASKLRCRWIYYHPLKLIQLYREKRRVQRDLQQSLPNLWLSYHSYYKAPDLLGPYCSKKLNIPYVIFQGIYSTKRRKKLSTLPGFLLNRRSLLQSDHIFTNKRRDYKNLLRIIPEKKLSYIAPGIQPSDFCFSEKDRTTLRSNWDASKEVIIMTAAMMRKGVKTDGISIVIHSCASLLKKGHNIRLIIAGDGECRNELEIEAAGLLKGKYTFVGKIRRDELHKYYSAADIFAFPGIDESLGMVYLEAQSCRLPVVAYEDWGAQEAIRHGETGLLSAASKREIFSDNIEQLISNPKLRDTLGRNGEQHIRSNHNLATNYALLQEKLITISNKRN